MNNRLFFNHMLVLAGIMMLTASICVASHDQNSNVDQPQNVSNWSIMQNAVPKLFGAGLAAGGVYGAYVYSGALKRYVTEQPLSALAQVTILGGGLLTNMWAYRKVNEFNQQRVNTSPERRSDLTDYDRVSNWARLSCALPGIVYSIYRTYNNCFSSSDTYVLGVCSVVSLANYVRSRDCKRDNYRYDDIDRKAMNSDDLKRCVESYNRSPSPQLKTSVQEKFTDYQRAYNTFSQSIKERGAQDQPWVAQVPAEYESIKGGFDCWEKSLNSSLGGVFYEDVFPKKTMMCKMAQNLLY